MSLIAISFVITDYVSSRGRRKRYFSLPHNQPGRMARVVQELREEREKREITLQQLGATCGVSRTGIGLIEKGNRSPSLLSLIRIADGLIISLPDLISASLETSRPSKS
ncbi:helix-turn-helix domain-containing protein [Caballeronia sp. TF1N1]|uniref:helix-turn-helix domain-containing protein n=1 Tax=Caballeronia sp. TF1N1 TaxID=2878153 RepID=UPI001FD4A637|nr:helix-turn-helix transcriptional regulator [Caballeronia sp. TF1N1]